MQGTALELSARLQQAIAHHQRGELAQAQSLCDEILKTHPAHGAALQFSGVIALQSGEPLKALSLIERALRIEPHNAFACFNQGVAFEALREFTQALASYERAIRLRPLYAEALFNRGNVLKRLDRLEEAVASFDQALAARPAYAAAHVNRGNALKNLGRTALALASYERALELDPTDAEIHCNRGTLLYEDIQPEAAVASFERALALRPDFAGAFQNRGYAFLLAGNFAAGWADHEWRWQNYAAPLARSRRNFVQPLWLGEHALAHKRILLHAEQGLGDTLQFCRYARLVADRGAAVILEVPAALAALLRNLAGVTQLVAAGDELPPFDLHCPLMSLPLAFGTTVSTIPAPVPYLQADPGKQRFWQQRLGEHRRLRVGLVWSGGFRPDQPELWYINRRRNISLSELALLRHPDIEFYSLQKGEPAESELAQLIAANWDGPHLHDFTAEFRDFADTAALLANLDLLVSVDTSVAHLAGALGKPVWVMNRFDTCWRWLLKRTDSPWYPSARLYRQARPGNWRGVVQNIREDLLRRVQSAPVTQVQG